MLGTCRAPLLAPQLVAHSAVSVVVVVVVVVCQTHYRLLRRHAGDDPQPHRGCIGKKKGSANYARKCRNTLTSMERHLGIRFSDRVWNPMSSDERYKTPIGLKPRQAQPPVTLAPSTPLAAELRASSAEGVTPRPAVAWPTS